MAVPSDGRGLVNELSPRKQDPKEEVQVFATSRWRPWTEMLIEPSDSHRDIALHGKAGTRPITANSERKELNIDLRSLLVSHAESRLDRCHRFVFPRFGFA